LMTTSVKTSSLNVLIDWQPWCLFNVLRDWCSGVWVSECSCVLKAAPEFLPIVSSTKDVEPTSASLTRAVWLRYFQGDLLTVVGCVGPQ
jgi:hypothetical protein